MFTFRWFHRNFSKRTRNYSGTKKITVARFQRLHNPIKHCNLLRLAAISAVLGVGAFTLYASATEKEPLTSVEDYGEIINNLFERVKAFLSQGPDEWHYDSRSNNCIGYVKRIGASEFQGIKVLGRISADANFLREGVWNWGFSEWNEYWEGNLKHWEILEQIDENTRVVRMVVKLERGVAITPREYIILQAKKSTEDGKNFFLYQSVSFPNKIPDTVRGNITLGAYVFEPSENGTTVLTHFIHQNPGGGVVPLIFNLPQEIVLQTPRKIEKILGIPSPPKEKFGQLFFKGKKAWVYEV